MEVAALQERLRGLENRTDANHNGLAEQRNANARQDKEIAVTHIELEGVREDLHEIRAQMKWVMRGLWAAAATFTVFFLGVAGLVLQIATHG